jgi:hypothetical protein
VNRARAFAFLALLFLPAIAQASEPPPAQVVPQPGEQSQEPANFDGMWEGKIFFDKEAFLAATSTPAAGTPVRIEIHGVVVRVFMDDGTGFSEAMPGSFHIAPVMGNATIFGTSFSDVWTETWVFVITHKDPDALLVNYTRVVNNDGVPLTDPYSKFSTRGYGELKKSAP